MKIKTKRMFSGVSPYHKYDIAIGQVETAIRLFLTDGCDMFSALTLAAAAGELLHRLVLNAGKRPFVDYVVRINEFQAPGKTSARSAIIRHIHELLFINRLKHYDSKESELVEFDVEECALAAILKAIADYQTLTGKTTTAMHALHLWCYKNLDSPEMMERWAKVPDELKETLKKLDVKPGR